MPLHIVTSWHGFDESFKQKRGILSRAVCLLHDNVRPHSAHVTTALLEIFKWDIYWTIRPTVRTSRPSDFHLFLRLKKHLAGKMFDDDDEVQDEFMTWFKVQAAEFSDSWIQTLVPRLNKCLDNAGYCVEK